MNVPLKKAQRVQTSGPRAIEVTATVPLFPKKKLTSEERAARLAGAVGAAETKALIIKGVVKPQMERMREMHETMARDREIAKTNPAYRFKTQQWWADHFGLKSTKTIQRDCECLRDRFHFPVWPIRERGGLGYTEDVGAFPLVSFSRGALVAICAAWRALEAYRGTSFEAEIEPTMKKLLGGLGMELTDYLERVLKRISFRSAGFQARMDADIFETVTQAVLDETELEFSYLKLEEARKGKAPSARRIRPRDLVCIGGAWYVFGEDLERKLAIREFALCRMSSATNMGTVFTPTTPFDLQAALKKCFGAHVSGTPEKVRVEFDAATAPLVDERDWHDTQVLTRLKDGGLRYEMEAPVCPEVVRWVLSFGSGATVHEPASLRERVEAEGRGMVGNHAADEQCPYPNPPCIFESTHRSICLP